MANMAMKSFEFVRSIVFGLGRAETRVAVFDPATAWKPRRARVPAVIHNLVIKRLEVLQLFVPVSAFAKRGVRPAVAAVFENWRNESTTSVHCLCE